MKRLTKRGAVTQKDIDELLELSNENQFGRNEAYYKLQYYEDLEEDVEEQKMDAVKYLKEKKRMIESLSETKLRCVDLDCSNCPLSNKNNGKKIACGVLQTDYPEIAVEIVEKWSEEHPQKTLLNCFKKEHPSAPLKKNGFPYVCPYILGYEKQEYCNSNEADCVACWNRPLDEVE